MPTLPDIAEKLAAALRRVVPYSDRLPPSAEEDVREALAAWDAYRSNPRAQKDKP